MVYGQVAGTPVGDNCIDGRATVAGVAVGAIACDRVDHTCGVDVADPAVVGHVEPTDGVGGDVVDVSHSSEMRRALVAGEPLLSCTEIGGDCPIEVDPADAVAVVGSGGDEQRPIWVHGNGLDRTERRFRGGATVARVTFGAGAGDRGDDPGGVDSSDQEPLSEVQRPVRADVHPVEDER